MTIANTTPLAIRPYVTQVLEGLTPRIQIKGAERWVSHDRRADPGMKTRRFRVEWNPLSQVESGGFFSTLGKQTPVLMSIVTDYSVAQQHLELIVEDDHTQVERALYQHLVRGETAQILVGIESEGASVVAQDETGDTIQVAHDFRVHYMRDWGYS